MLQINVTFNKEARRLLLYNLISIDNCCKTFPAMQLFATNESAREFEKVEDVQDRFIFHDYPGPAVLAGDFVLGLAASIARSAIKKKEAASKAKDTATGKGKERAVDDDGCDSGVHGVLDEIVIEYEYPALQL